MKKRKKLLSFGILLIGIVLLLQNCNSEESTFHQEPNIDAQTVSFEEAKNFFNSNSNKNYAAKGANNFSITPDWNSLSQNTLYYTDALLTKANASINRQGNYSSELYFIKVNGQMKNVIFTIFKHKQTSNGNILDATVFFNDLDGKFIDGYKIENGLFTKRLVATNKENIQKASFLSFLVLLQGTIGDEEIFWCDGAVGGNLETVWLGTIASSTSNGGSYQNFINNAAYQEDINRNQSNNNDSGNSHGGGTSAGTGITPSGLSSAAGTILTYLPVDVDNQGNCPEGYIKDGNNCVPAPEQIINNLSGKAECVYGKLKNLSIGFKNAIKKFDGEFPVSHLKFMMKDLKNNIRAQTSSPKNYIITIALNSNNSVSGVNYRPNLLTAKTIIHEVIHAEMFRKMLSLANTNGSISVSKLNQMLQQGDYSGMLDYYTRFGVKGFQHQQMAQHYRNTIADILAQFDNNAHNRQFYLDLAWEGLDKTAIVAWENAISQLERDRIHKTIKDYIDANKNQTCQ